MSATNNGDEEMRHSPKIAHAIACRIELEKASTREWDGEQKTKCEKMLKEMPLCTLKRFRLLLKDLSLGPQTTEVER